MICVGHGDWKKILYSFCKDSKLYLWSKLSEKQSLLLYIYDYFWIFIVLMRYYIILFTHSHTHTQVQQPCLKPGLWGRWVGCLPWAEQGRGKTLFCARLPPDTHQPPQTSQLGRGNLPGSCPPLQAIYHSCLQSVWSYRHTLLQSLLGIKVGRVFMDHSHRRPSAAALWIL